MKQVESGVESDVVVYERLGGFEDLEALASELYTGQRRNQPVWRHSSNLGAGGGLSSTRQDDSQRHRPRHPNLLVGSVVEVVLVVSWVVVAVAQETERLYQEMLVVWAEVEYEDVPERSRRRKWEKVEE